MRKKTDFKILDTSFYRQADVVSLAQQLLGKVICTSVNQQYTSGMITETEAYAGVIDKASHAYNGKRTPRTEIMYAAGGIAYVYLIYGMYSLFNVVTNQADIPHAVLIRSIEPLEGLEVMENRVHKSISKKSGVGPGRLSRLLGIHYSMSGHPLIKPNGDENAIWIEDRGILVPASEIKSGKRIGVDYAGADADLPYRFWIDGKL